MDIIFAPSKLAHKLNMNSLRLVSRLGNRFKSFFWGQFHVSFNARVVMLALHSQFSSIISVRNGDPYKLIHK